MKIAIIVSKMDVAGLNIKDKLQRYHNFLPTEQMYDQEVVLALNENVSLYTIEQDSIHSEHIDQKIDCDLIIYATKHQSAAGTHSLSVHVPGNFGMAGAGGKDGFLGICMSSYMKYAYKLMKEYAKDMDYEIIQECTHHGPEINKPNMFIEIGSDKESWEREDAGKVIAKIIIELVTKEIPKLKEFIIIGGMHYNYIADKINSLTNYCVGHICTKYNMDKVDSDMVDQLVEKSESKKPEFIFDWKGSLSADVRNNIIKILDDKNITWHRSDKFFKNL